MHFEIRRFNGAFKSGCIVHTRAMCCRVGLIWLGLVLFDSFCINCVGLFMHVCVCVWVKFMRHRLWDEAILSGIMIMARLRRNIIPFQKPNCSSCQKTESQDLFQWNCMFVCASVSMHLPLFWCACELRFPCSETFFTRNEPVSFAILTNDRASTIHTALNIFYVPMAIVWNPGWCNYFSAVQRYILI